ncbi:DUF6194 family protein [Microbacterium pumilum]|uniref:DUF6194 family protein n=1 Tax=Microbacterium pumilum TaxID=344165 RepID=A0ABN2T3K1_9MICO
MSIEQIVDTIRSFEGTLVLAPDESSGFPEIAWGDYFFYYAPDGEVPQNVQPFATIVTKDYPDDTQSQLDGDDRWRVNVHVGRRVFHELTGQDPRTFEWTDFATPDTFMPHPVYGSLGWIAVVSPGEKANGTLLDLLSDAHRDARARTIRRESTGD